jgi:hypothetical protein
MASCLTKGDCVFTGGTGSAPEDMMEARDIGSARGGGGACFILLANTLLMKFPSTDLFSRWPPHIVYWRGLHGASVERAVWRDGLHGETLRRRTLERGLVCKGACHGGLECLVVGALGLWRSRVWWSLGWIIPPYAGAVTIVVSRRGRVECGADGGKLGARWVSADVVGGSVG